MDQHEGRRYASVRVLKVPSKNIACGHEGGRQQSDFSWREYANLLYNMQLLGILLVWSIIDHHDFICGHRASNEQIDLSLCFISTISLMSSAKKPTSEGLGSGIWEFGVNKALFIYRAILAEPKIFPKRHPT